MGGSTMNIVLIVIVVGVIVFAIVSAVVSRKNKRLERQKRKKEVKYKIKAFLKTHDNLRNVRLEYEKVAARKGKEYKYRDIFDVIVDIYDSKTNKLISTRAFEIEGMSKKITKKNFETTWVVNVELDLADTRRQIGIVEGTVKLSNEEKIAQKKLLKEQTKRYQDNLKPVRHKKKKNLAAKDNLEKLAAKKPIVKPIKFTPAR